MVLQNVVVCRLSLFQSPLLLDIIDLVIVLLKWWVLRNRSLLLLRFRGLLLLRTYLVAMVLTSKVVSFHFFLFDYVASRRFSEFYAVVVSDDWWNDTMWNLMGLLYPCLEYIHTRKSCTLYFCRLKVAHNFINIVFQRIGALRQLFFWNWSLL